MPETCDGAYRYSRPCKYDVAYEAVKAAIFDGFYGPADKGIYSPSVQYTLYDMARLAIKRYAGHLIKLHSKHGKCLQANQDIIQMALKSQIHKLRAQPSV